MKRKWGAFLAVLILALAFCLPGMALAGSISVGEITNYGSWSQAFNENGIYASAPNFVTGADSHANSFNSAIAILRTGDGFETGSGFEGGFSGLPAGWTGTFVSSNEIKASGALRGDLSNTLHFLGSSSTPLSFDWYIFNGATLVGAQGTFYNGNGGWSYGEATAPVPIPPTALLLGSGLLGIGLLRFRRRQPTA